MKYQKEINLLRAIAVLLVIFFHAGIKGFEFGYLGVDVFFVISGYLIFGKINHQCSKGEFSYRRFYLSRLRRLMPALFFMMLLTVIFSLIVMLPYDLKNYGQSLVASVFSANNVLLYLTSGYWSTASEFKPLYHTWSLALEEQFYLIAPIFFVAIINMRLNLTIRLILFFVVFTISLGRYLSVNDLEYKYLMLDARIWQLMFGAFVFEISKSCGAEKRMPIISCRAIGVALIVISQYNFHVSQELNRMLAVAGAAFFLIPPVDYFEGDLNIFFKSFEMIGLMSYSLYLWHQPVLSYFKYINEGHIVSFQVFIAILLIIFISYISWRFLEDPVRKRKLIASDSALLAAFLAMAFLLCSIGLVFHFTYGFKRYSKYDYGDNPQEFVDNPRRLKSVTLDPNNKSRNIIVMGNSFARDFINILKNISYLSDFSIKYYENSCDNIKNKSFVMDVRNSKYFFFSENWAQGAYSEKEILDLKMCSNSISELNTQLKFYVVGVKNFGINNGFVKIGNPPFDYRVKMLDSVSKFNSVAKIEIKNYIDILDLVSDDVGVRILDDDGKLLTYDTNHLTRAGSIYFANLLSPKILRILNSD